MPRLGRRVPPIVVAAIHVADRGRDKVCGIEVVQSRDADGDIVAANLLDIAVAIDVDAAIAAETVMALHRVELIVAERILAGEEPEIGGLQPASAPVPRLPA